MKNLLIILTGLALIALSLWLTNEAMESEMPEWMKCVVLK